MRLLQGDDVSMQVQCSDGGIMKVLWKYDSHVTIGMSQGLLGAVTPNWAIFAPLPHETSSNFRNILSVLLIVIFVSTNHFDDPEVVIVIFHENDGWHTQAGKSCQ